MFKHKTYAVALGILLTTNQYAFSGECATGTAPSAGCTVGVDDTTYTMTGNITPASGAEGIEFEVNSDGNTINLTGNITTTGSTAYGYYLSQSDSNTNTIIGNIRTDSAASYGIHFNMSQSNNLTLTGNISTEGAAANGLFISGSDNNTFTINGNISTEGSSARGIYLSSADSNDLTMNGNISTSGSSAHGFHLQGGSTGISFTNLGTISTSASGTFGINIEGSTLATLNNSQSGLTYNGKIPTNYNVVINSTSDYGKTVFSSVSGTTTFNIFAGSVLETETTYASVIDGLESSNITAESGTYTDSGKSYAWTLTNISANLWDLVVGLCTGCIKEDTDETIEEIGDGIASEFSQLLHKSATANFANMNTYDCGLFDQEGKCFSIGVRHTDVNGNNNSDSSSSGAVAVGGYKFNENFRVSGFVDQQAARRNPKGLKVHNKGPMVGLNLVWNQFADHLGFQVRVANAYQAKDMTITRSEIGVAEAGRGDTEIEVQSYVAEVSYQFSDGVKTSYRPYFASRRAIIKQDGYTETGVDNPLTFNTLEDKSTTLVMGMKAKHKLNNTITLNGALGVEHDISNNVDKIQATSSTITGLTPVDLNTSINKTRPVVTLGATYSIRPNQSLVAQTQYQELSYTSNSAKTAYFNYNIGF